MIATHPFWLGLLSACILWYSTITVYVAIKGAFDIRRMLQDLHQRDLHQRDRDADLSS